MAVVMQYRLSRSDEFPEFATSTQQERDAALLRATTELFVQELAHDADEIRRYEELAVLLLPKVPSEDRLFIAERLAERSDAPPAVIRMLAKDAIEIAEPVLRRSPVPSPLDLLAIIAATTPEHHRLIAERPALSAEVMRALRISGDRELLEMLDQVDAALRPTMERELPGATSAPGVGRSGYRADAASAFSRFDPWHFLGLERGARLHLMAELATRPPIRRYSGQAGRLDRAFRSILGAAQIVGFVRAGERQSLVKAIADSLEIEADFILAALDDASGEPLAVLLKALGLDNMQAQQVFLLATPVGREVTPFFKLCDLYAGMEPVVAETLAEAWRGVRHATPRHEPVFSENGDRRRQGAVETTRDRPAIAIPLSPPAGRGSG
jgi:hypothetical protein